MTKIEHLERFLLEHNERCYCAWCKQGPLAWAVVSHHGFRVSKDEETKTFWYVVNRYCLHMLEQNA